MSERDAALAVMETSFQPAVITADWAGMRKRLQELIAPYEGLTAEAVAGMGMKDAKACRTDLKKMSNELNDARRAIKREYNRPLADFEAHVKELDALILEPWKLLDAGIKLEEENARYARRAQLDEAYRDFAPALYDVVPLERLLEREWTNKSFGETKAEDALLAKVASVAQDWEAFQKMAFSFPKEAEAEFFRTLSLRAAIEYDARRADEQARIDRMKAEVVANKELNATPCITVDASAHDASRLDFEPVAVFLIACEATVSQREGFVDYMKRCGMHGHVLSTFFADADEAIEAVRCDVRG
ncbi:DUF1351 domain-containing protein [Xiamenia xianingshaonis]|uniref:DUF1351 domain-containing protein n=1 Tax=Xiamenia xianingshaonis TaxID=2682776 RepID=A0A9E6MRW3_9ACTN|nr:DUF1351 domain-containing protein [Xiamenia xianingshaonis]NHM14461.1 DUF1351 domain-containing protein [Xiamenia xianingshaonis]QTU84935.1 DUF1351 domain-containing protein [Xiamenia xianingshaonis]